MYSCSDLLTDFYQSLVLQRRPLFIYWTVMSDGTGSDFCLKHREYSLGFLQQLHFPQLEHTKVNVFLAENQEF